MEHLTDLDECPLGKYKGTLMQDVPCEYLHWFWTEIVDRSSNQKVRSILDYIKENISALKMENKDLIWKIRSDV